MREENNSALGHICYGGGAKITNSPINIHIHIHSEDESLIYKLKRVIYGIAGQRHRAIGNASQLSTDELQGSIIRQIENG